MKINVLYRIPLGNIPSSATVGNFTVDNFFYAEMSDKFVSFVGLDKSEETTLASVKTEDFICYYQIVK